MYRRSQLISRFFLTFVLLTVLLTPTLVSAQAGSGRSSSPTAVMDRAYYLNVRSGPRCPGYHFA